MGKRQVTSKEVIMKRFWLDEHRWWGMTYMTRPILEYTSNTVKILMILLIIQFIPLCAAVGQKCKIGELNQCLENEMCDEKAKIPVCVCKPGFVKTGNSKCEVPTPTPEPSPSHIGLSVGITLIVILIVIVLILVILHRRFGFLSSLLSYLPNIRPFGSSGGRTQLQVVEGDDDVNPIV